MRVATPQELLLEDIKDLFDAGKQVARALPKMAKSAHAPELQQSLREHLEMTRGRTGRLERIFALMGAPARGKPCVGMRGLVEEGRQIVGEDRAEALMDAGIVAAARKMEHYGIVSCESARELAQQAGQKEVAQILQETLVEALRTDKRLAQISRRVIMEAARVKPVETRQMGGMRRARAVSKRRGGRMATAGSSGIVGT